MSGTDGDDHPTQPYRPVEPAPYEPPTPEQPRARPQPPGPYPPGTPYEPGVPHPDAYARPMYLPAYVVQPVNPAPFGLHPVTGEAYSGKTRTTAGVLQLVLSVFGLPGIGRLYAGHTGIGLTQLLVAVFGYITFCFTLALPAVAMIIWGVIDGIVILASDPVRDGQGRVLR